MPTDGRLTLLEHTPKGRSVEISISEFRPGAWSLEPRIWLNADGTYRLLFAGFYGEAGDFDNQRMHIDDNRTGKFAGLGLSVGGHIPITDRLGVELGLRAGYSRRTIDYYTPENEHYYFDYDKKRNKFGITGINISIVYRFIK